MHDHMGVQAMSAWEGAGHPRIVPLEERTRLRREDRIVFVAEQAMAERTVLVRNAVELVSLHFPKVLNRLLRDMELRFAVLAPIHPFVPADEEDVILLRQEERRVDANAREPLELLLIILRVNHRQ